MGFILMYNMSTLLYPHWDEKKSRFLAKEKGGSYDIKWRFLTVNYGLFRSSLHGEIKSRLYYRRIDAEITWLFCPMTTWSGSNRRIKSYGVFL